MLLNHFTPTIAAIFDLSRHYFLLYITIVQTKGENISNINRDIPKTVSYSEFTCSGPGNPDSSTQCVSTQHCILCYQQLWRCNISRAFYWCLQNFVPTCWFPSISLVTIWTDNNSYILTDPGPTATVRLKQVSEVQKCTKICSLI